MDQDEQVVKEKVKFDALLPTEHTTMCIMIKDTGSEVSRLARYRSGHLLNSADAWIHNAEYAKHFDTVEDAQTALSLIWSDRIERAHAQALIEHKPRTRKGRVA